MYGVVCCVSNKKVGSNGTTCIDFAFRKKKGEVELLQASLHYNNLFNSISVLFACTMRQKTCCVAKRRLERNETL